jgi:REP element-mobilizing transposase RayT
MIETVADARSLCVANIRAYTARSRNCSDRKRAGGLGSSGSEAKRSAGAPTPHARSGTMTRDAGGITERRHRLPMAAYAGARMVAFTACVRDRHPLFRDVRVGEVFAGSLTESATRHGCDVVVYCFMPDHVHAVLQGRDARSHCKRAFDAFKYDTGLWLARSGCGAGWQKDYHDHIVRASEDWLARVRYIIANPLRAGIADDARAYPLSGSSLYSVGDLLDGLQ